MNSKKQKYSGYDLTDKHTTDSYQGKGTENKKAVKTQRIYRIGRIEGRR